MRAFDTQGRIRRSALAPSHVQALRVDTGSTLPAEKVIGTDPPAGKAIPLDQLIQIKVSLGNQFVVPQLTGMFYNDVVPYLAGLGFTGPLLNGGDIPGAADKDKNRVLKQDPPAGTTTGYTSTITLSYGS